VCELKPKSEPRQTPRAPTMSANTSYEINGPSTGSRMKSENNWFQQEFTYVQPMCRREMSHTGRACSALYISAFVYARVPGIALLGVLELVGELRCCISSGRNSPQSLGQVAPGLEGFGGPLRMSERVSKGLD